MTYGEDRAGARRTTYQGAPGDWLLDRQDGGWLYRWWPMALPDEDCVRLGPAAGDFAHLHDDANCRQGCPGSQQFADDFEKARRRAWDLVARFPSSTDADKRATKLVADVLQMVETEASVIPTVPTTSPLVRFLCSAEAGDGTRCRRQMGTVHLLDGRYMLGNVTVVDTPQTQTNVSDAAFGMIDAGLPEVAKALEQTLDVGRMHIAMYLDDPSVLDPFPRPVVSCSKHGTMGWHRRVDLREDVSGWRKQAKSDTPMIVLCNPQTGQVRLDS